MNWPGVLADDPVVLEKLRVARESGRVVDGHAPGLRGDDARAYAAHGITTDHECFTLEEALDKIAAGMKILIREGSAARNFDALHPLLSSHPQACMLCSDDLHPDALVQGHLDRLVRRALEAGHDAYDVLRAACVHPVRHYGLPVGLLQPGEYADLIVVDGLERLTVLQTYVRGRLVAERGATRIAHVAAAPINNFTVGGVAESSLRVSARGPRLRVIEALDGQLVTRERIVPRRGAAGPLAADPERDVLKLAVVNRYREAAPALAFIAGFGLKRGALASSVAHDSHNVVAVGASDADLARATNAVLAQRGGIAVACDGAAEVLPLPIAGLMSADDGYQVARRYAALDARAKELGSRLRAPFMTLSFMALLVIPALKLSDRGLFDGQRFAFTPLSVE
jgi:adenine deaminase